MLVQLHAFGDVGSLAEMREIVRCVDASCVIYEPDPATDRWSGLYERFRAVLDAEVLTG